MVKKYGLNIIPDQTLCVDLPISCGAGLFFNPYSL